MSHLQMDHDPHHHHSYDDHSQPWHDNGVFNPNPPQHQSPVQDFSGMPFSASYAPLPMEPIYTTQMHPPRTTQPQLQRLIMPQAQWPSMLSSQSQFVSPMYPSVHTPVPITPASAITPVSATSTTSRASATPRKTLTDEDRRNMCLFHEKHPNVKQTEIGAKFGVERSTVSKVLRQKDKYLYQDDGSRSPVRRSKGKFPDIERALANWAQKQQKQGLPLTDAIIQEKARFFASSVGNSEGHHKANSTSWLEKFKQKHHLGSKSRKGSMAEESEGTSNPPSTAHTPGGISPTSPSGVDSPLTAKKSDEDLKLKLDSPDAFDFSTHARRPFHSVSNTSLSSVFTDMAPSSLSAGPTSPTSLSSPFFTPDSAISGTNPFMGTQQPRGQPASSSFQRPRSQTFPLLIGVEQYMSPPPSSEALTPKYINSTALDSPMAELHPPLPAIDDVISEDQSPTQANSMQPPPVPALPTLNGNNTVGKRTASAPAGVIDGNGVLADNPSQEEAARALELVMNFFQQQPQGTQGSLEPQEYVMIGKLMEKLKIKRAGLGLGDSAAVDVAMKTESVDVTS